MNNIIRQTRVMEAETIQKNAASPKSHTSKGNLKEIFRKLAFMLLFAGIFISANAQTANFESWHIGYPNASDVTAVLKDSTLTIVGNGTMKELDLNEAWRKGKTKDQIKTVIIKDGVKNISVHAFSYCGNLINVTIPESVTIIEKNAFLRCENLIEITIPDNVTTIGDYAFCECKNLTIMNIPKKIQTTGEGAFYGCPSLTVISFPEKMPDTNWHIGFDLNTLKAHPYPYSGLTAFIEKIEEGIRRTDERRLAPIKKAQVGDKLALVGKDLWLKEGNRNIERYSIAVTCFIERIEGDRYQLRASDVKSTSSRVYQMEVNGVKVGNGSVFWARPLTDGNYWVYVE